jgi:hypothetical protein
VLPSALVAPLLLWQHLGIRKAAYRKKDKESAKSK